MLDQENTCPALGFEAADTDFWALVCEDEEWLQAEFDVIVSEPAETHARLSRRPTEVAAPQPGGTAWHRGISGSTRARRTGERPGPQGRRERSPPTKGEPPTNRYDTSLMEGR